VIPGPASARWRLASVALLAAVAGVILLTFLEYGTVWDEEIHYLYGEYVLRWFTSGFQDRSAHTLGDLWQYGALFDVIADLAVRASPLGIYETRHLVTAAFGFAGLVATWRIGVLVGGQAVGFASLLSLVLVPLWYGHSFANPKDVPFATLATWALFLVMRSARLAPRVAAGACVATGVAIGAALAVRVGGAFLFGYLGLIWGAWTLRNRAPGDSLAAAAGTLALRLALVLAVAWPVMLSFWPWAQVAPFTRPFEAIAAATRFRWVGPMLFDGAIVQSTELPWNYLPTWFAVTMPEFLLLGLLAGAFVLLHDVVRRRSRRRETWLDLGALALAVGFPFLVVFTLRPVMYDANRQFLFVVPPLAVLAGWGILALARRSDLPRWVRWGIPALAAFLAVVTAVDMVRLHPYQTIYFNRAIAGGVPSAARRFEADYWGQSYREGMEVVIRHYRPEGPWPVRVANCGVRFLSGYWLAQDGEASRHFVMVTPEQDPDILLATTRYRCMSDPGRLLHVVERMGAPILYVYERHRRGEWVAAGVK
jgi:4-amino-4-deoxy-L-arabinose transferase-like glycosyltransferase